MDGFGARFGIQQGRIVVAIPVRNEADRIEDCLLALSRQTSPVRFTVLLFLNNTVDKTALVIQSLLPVLPFETKVIEHRLPPAQQSAGHARRMAMEIAATLTGSAGTLLCTDADGRVAPDWLAANLSHIRRGADAVAGRATIDPVEAALIPQVLHNDDARECAYAAVVDEIESLIDPDPADPWPRHTEQSGASICVTADAFRLSGGVPAVPVGEDRAFFDALQRIDARIRHAMDVQVTVSGRLHGRAKGGMADTIRRRMLRPDPFLDDRLSSADATWRRSHLRRDLREAFMQPGALRHALRALGCIEGEAEHYCGLGNFGAVWSELQSNWDVLRSEPVAVADLPRQMAHAVRLRDALLRQDAMPGDAPAKSYAVGAG